MTQKGKSRNVLASPLGEEGHEVAKGWTVVRMIMILDVDVTAERRHYNTHRPAGDTTTLGAKGPVKLKNPWAEGPSILRTFPFTTLLHNLPPSGGHNLRGEAPSTLAPKGETTHYDLCVALLLHPLLSLTHWIFRSLMLPYKSSSHSANHVRCARQRRVPSYLTKSLFRCMI